MWANCSTEDAPYLACVDSSYIKESFSAYNSASTFLELPQANYRNSDVTHLLEVPLRPTVIAARTLRLCAMRVVHRFRHCHSGLLVRGHTDFTRNATQKHNRTVYTGHDDVRD